MWKRMFIMLAIVGLLAAALNAFDGFKNKMMTAAFAKMAPPPPAVTTLVARGQTWHPVLNSVGSLKAIQGVQVSTDLPGIISEIAFESGKPVKKGDLLIKLDTKQEEAQLRAAEARRDLAKVNLARKQDLLDKRATSQAEYDSAAAEARQAEASVEEVRALIDRKYIRAPFDGLLGIRQVNLGQYLNAGVPIVPLESCDPIYVEFNLPQQHLNQIALHNKVRLTAPGVCEKEFQGEITAIDSRVDEATRNVQIEATIRNPERKLRAGMFTNVELLLPEQKGVLAIPASSINYAPYGDSIFIVKEIKLKDGTAQKQAIQQFVKLGASRGDQITVLSGLKEEDEVITSGVFKLRSNEPVEAKASAPLPQPVNINNEIQPGNEGNPNPPDT
ncbi:MAG: efflux RND transporter periplasmic adaptor subunit [Verrucomicrobia bacterium]|nr:efflux RND transporter periplasmic adaptor subunit [Verrucomicrobiota bacterium]